MSSEPREYLVRKDGYYYRPNCSGYTTSKFEAGRYTKAEAEREAAVEPWHMKAIHQDDVVDDPASSRVRMDTARIEALEAENARKDAALATILGLIGNVEHKGGGANAARMYADMLNNIRDVARRAREGGNADG